jgi:hypothetical protein
MKKVILTTLVLSTSFLSPIDAWANHACSGKVISVDIHAPGYVLTHIEGSGQGNRVCSLSEAYGEISTEACNAMYSLLLSAKATDKPIKMWFNNDSDVSCNKGQWKFLADWLF